MALTDRPYHDIPPRATRHIPDDAEMSDASYEEHPVARAVFKFNSPSTPRHVPKAKRVPRTATVPKCQAPTQVDTKPIPKGRYWLILPLWHLWRRFQPRNRALLLIGMLTALVMYLLGSQVLIPLGQWTSTHWRGGEAHVLQYDLNVGHHGTSTFFTHYYHGQAIVIEYPGGDISKPREYVVTDSLSDQVAQPLVLLATIAGMQPGKPDLLLEIEGRPIKYRLRNTGEGFTSPSFL